MCSRVLAPRLCPQLWGSLCVQGSVRLDVVSGWGFWHRSTPQTAPALLTWAWQFLFPGSAGRAALHPQQHKWGWLTEWKMLVVNSQAGRIWEWEPLLNPGPILNPTGGGMAGLLCSPGLSVNIQPLTSQLESHLVIISVSPG